MPNKPEKPRSDFPLYAHPCGSWAKRVGGVIYYFGGWDDPQAALEEYQRWKDDSDSGRRPNSNGKGLTVKRLVNSFLNSKKRLLDCREIRQSTFQDYYDNCKRVVKVFSGRTFVSSLGPTDFEKLRSDFAKTHGPVTLCGDITCTRVLFKYADDTFDVRVKFGQGFKKPSRANLRKHRLQRQPKMFQPPELRKIIKEAGVQLRAMIYHGLNCAFGNHDCAMLTFSALDLERGWVNFPRPKTGINRRCPLWPETIEAVKAAIAARPNPKDEVFADRVFITKYGSSWEPKTNKQNDDKGTASAKDNPISKEMAKLLKSAKVKLYRKGVGFYALRHIFQTIGEKSRDKDAVRAIMGHAESANDMSAVYNEEPIDDDRLRAVTDFVRTWLITPTSQRQSA
jgi:integrase